MTPFVAFCVQNPPSVLSYILGVSKVWKVEKHITVCDTILHALKQNLVMAQNRMKQQADQGNSECHFVEEDQVFLQLQPYKNTSLKSQHFKKLTPKFHVPYIVLKDVGLVAYRLSLPSLSKFHPIFHVSCLKKVVGTKCQNQTSLPELDEEGSIWL
jgi:hypothetical protein